MDIHVVQPGDTLYGLARRYGVPLDRLLWDNQLQDPSQLAVGQALVVQYPEETLTLRPGETLREAARRGGLSLRQLLRNNPQLADGAAAGQTLVLSFQQEKLGVLSVSGDAYPDIAPALLERTLPFLTALSPFACTYDAGGVLSPPADRGMAGRAKAMGVRPLLLLANLLPDGSFSPELAHTLLTDGAVQGQLLTSLLALYRREGFGGVDLDLEYVPGEDAAAYARFVSRLRERIAPLGGTVTVDLAPKTSADQPGALYEGHDYRLLGQAADFVFLMTYEWGHTYGPPMAVAPLRNVRLAAEYAGREIPPQKIWLGIPNYGYDWTLPYRQGSRARSLSNPEAVRLAYETRTAIRFDQAAQSPWFRYGDGEGREHEVWFEDPRSIRAKLDLARELGFRGVSYWNLMRPFPQNWTVLNALYQIREADAP